MTLVNLAQVLEPARTEGRGVAAFNVIQIEHAEAFATAAEKVSLPVVMQISENCVRYHGSLAPIAAATLAIADDCDQPVVVHLDHAEDAGLVEEAVRLGLTSVMYDGSRLSDTANRAQTRRVVEQCRAQREQELDESMLEAPERDLPADEDEDGEFDPDEDPLLERAIEVVVQAQTASVSLLQRRLRVGYTRAGRLIDMLERRGIISPYEGSKPRRVLVGESETLAS